MGRRVRDPGYFHQSLPPLPEPVYPRVITKPTCGPLFWTTWVVVKAIESTGKLCILYLLWFIYDRPASLFLKALAVWAVAEVMFGFYYLWLASTIQDPAPGTVMSYDALSDLFLRCLHSGLVVNSPLARTRAYSAPGAWPQVRESVQSVLEHLNEERPDCPDLPSNDSARSGLGNGIRTETPPRRRMTRLNSTAAQMPYTPDDDDPLFDANGRPKSLDANDPRAVEFREQLRTWFYHAPWEDIHEEDVRHWLAWSAFGKPLRDVTAPKQVRFLNRTLEMMQARTGTKFPPGRSGTKMILLTLDPVKTRPRPLAIYAIANSINWFLRNIWYPKHGAIIFREGAIDYLLRIPPGWTPEKGRKEPNAMPVCYMHGLGFGLFQNHLLLHHLVHSLPTHPLLFPIAHHTSQEVWNRRYLKPWSRTELVETLKAACQRFGFWSPEEGGGLSMLSHSNGTVHHAWVIKDAPELLKRNTLVDPVVFCLWEGDIANNFCYRIPHTPLELLLDYFVASEVGIANYIHRYFIWSDNTLFVDEIPNVTDPTKTAIFLGGKDIIIDGPRTRRYLERSGAGQCLHWNENGGHGDGLLGKSRDRVVMCVGTGDTKGWEKWLARGRRSHSVGQADLCSPGLFSDSDSSEEMRKRF